MYLYITIASPLILISMYRHATIQFIFKFKSFAIGPFDATNSSKYILESNLYSFYFWVKTTTFSIFEVRWFCDSTSCFKPQSRRAKLCTGFQKIWWYKLVWFYPSTIWLKTWQLLKRHFSKLLRFVNYFIIQQEWNM